MVRSAVGGGNGHAALGIDPPSADLVIGDAPGEMPPAPAQLGGPAVAISGADGTYGGEHFCAARADGAVVCWGDGAGPNGGDNSGLLGPLEYAEQGMWNVVGELPGELPPLPIVLGPAPAVAVSVAHWSACAVDQVGALRCWGEAWQDWADWPLLGYGTVTRIGEAEDFPPPPVNLGVGVLDVVHEVERTCVLGVDHLVRCFGTGLYALLGQPDTGPTAVGDSIEPPPVVELGGTVAQLSGSPIWGTMCALNESGTVRCFGSLTMGYGLPYGLIGDDPGEMPPPPLELGPEPAVKIALALGNACALFEGGNVRCWGGGPSHPTWGYEAAINYGVEPGDMPPPPLDLGGPAIDIAGGAWGTLCAILEDHRVVCWGRRGLGLEQPTMFDVGDEPGEMPPPPIRLYG